MRLVFRLRKLQKTTPCALDEFLRGVPGASGTIQYNRAGLWLGSGDGFLDLGGVLGRG